MTSQTASGRIVVGIDDSTSSRPALEWAADQAVLREVPLVVLYASTLPAVAWPVPPAPTGYLEWQSEIGRDILRDAGQVAEQLTRNKVSVTTELAMASPTAALVEASHSATMIVVGSRGRGALARTLLGSVSTGLLHRARCPVAVVRDDGPAPNAEAPVLLGFDGSAASEEAVALAFEEAALRRVELVALHAWWSPGAFEMPGFEWETLRPEVDREVSRQLSGWQRRHPDVTVTRMTVPDKPAERLVEQSRSAQLLVVGSRGLGAVTSTLLGSVSSAVAQAATIPMVVVNPR